MSSEIETTKEIDKEKKTTDIVDLKPRMNYLDVIFKVIEKSEPREITSRRDGVTHLLATATVGDETGIIQLPLWNLRVQEIELGKTYMLENCYTGLFKGRLQLKMGNRSILTEIDDEIEVNPEVDMSNEIHDNGRYQRRSRKYGRRYSRQDKQQRRRWY